MTGASPRSPTRWRGKRLNSPNDVVVKSDGTIWFTDPSYGIADDYLGRRGESEIEGCHVYRVDPSGGAVTMVADDFVRPNGLAFSPDETLLYVADSGRTVGRRASGPYPGLCRRCGQPPVRRPRLCRLHRRRLRRLPCRRKWESLGERRRRHPLLRTRRRADRQGARAGGRLELRVRRRSPQPSVHHGDDIALCGLPHNQWRGIAMRKSCEKVGVRLPGEPHPKSLPDSTVALAYRRYAAAARNLSSLIRMRVQVQSSRCWPGPFDLGDSSQPRGRHRRPPTSTDGSRA